MTHLTTNVFYKVLSTVNVSSSDSIHILNFDGIKLDNTPLGVSIHKQGVTTANRKNGVVSIPTVFFINFGIHLRIQEKVLRIKVRI